MKASVWMAAAVAAVAAGGLLYVSIAGAAGGNVPENPIRVSKGYSTILFPSPKGAEDKVPPVAFSHRGHKTFGINNCRKCHNDEVFAKKQEMGLNTITMDAIYAGKFCGACHNGKTESPSSGKPIFAAEKDNALSCKRCHNVKARAS